MCNEKSKNASTLSSVPTLFLTLNPEKKKEKKKKEKKERKDGAPNGHVSTQEFCKIYVHFLKVFNLIYYSFIYSLGDFVFSKNYSLPPKVDSIF
jgi:hypothetical protein